MPSRRRTSRQRLATRSLARSLELSVAAPTVIAHRVGRLLAAGARPSRADRNEFQLMGTEKVLAFYQSWAAMWAQAGTTQLQLMQSFWRMPSWPPSSPARLVTRVLTGQAAALTKMLDAGMAPVHAKAVGNAKRLSRRKYR